MKTMKLNSTPVFSFAKKKITWAFFSFSFFLSASVQSQSLQLLTKEEFISTFNTGYTCPVNSSFEGFQGNWAAFSNDDKATAAVNNFANNYSAPYSIELVNNSNSGVSASYVQITSPEISLSGVVCTGKVDFFCWIYGEQLSSANTGTRLKIEFFDGTSWGTIWQKSAAQLLSSYGLNTWSQVYMMLSPSYFVSNFKYRFVLTTPAGNTNTTKIRIDNCELYNYSCGAKASLGNFVWVDANYNGVQDAGEKGLKGMTVDLKNSSGSTVASTVTGDDGSYYFLGVDPDNYTVHFRPVTTGYTNSPKNQGPDNSKDSDPDVTTGEASVTLAADEFNTTIDFGLAPGTPLPVKLMSFNVAYNKNNRIANVLWSIDNNTDMERFEIERSTDGRNFSPIALVLPSADNTVSYQFSDNLSGVTTSIIYYRLLIIEKNGEVKYSKIVVVRRDLVIADNTLQLMPNPAVSYSSIRINATDNGTAVLKLVDLGGRVATKFETRVTEGVNTIQLNNLGNFAKGYYMVQVQLNGKTFSSKLILQ